MLRIVINNEEIEVLNQQDIGLSLSKRAIDPAQPFARLGSRSYTVKFPATNINNRIFNNGNHTQTTNKFRQYTCKVYDGSTLLISGDFKLQQITRDTYEGYIVSNNVSFKDLISDKSIQDLDLGSFRFVANKKDDEINGVTLQDTWNPDFEYFNTMWLPLISYGNFFKGGAFDRNAKIDELSFEDFTPNFSYTDIFRKIFEEAGYTVSGELVDDVRLKDMMFTFQGDKVPWNWELLTRVILTGTQIFDTSNTDIGTFDTSPNPLIANKRRYYLQDVTETKDHLAKYDNANTTVNNFPVGQEWLCPREGTYEFTFSMSTQQHVITTSGDDANALEQAKHNKICLVNVDGADTSDENSPLFTDTTTPYANTTTPVGAALYDITVDIDLAVNETKTVIYDLAQGGAIDGQYNPITGEYTAANDETVSLSAYFLNQPSDLLVQAYINGKSANIELQRIQYIVPQTAQGAPDLANRRVELQSPFTYFYPTRDILGVPISEVPQVGFGDTDLNETPFQLQAGDVFTFTVTNQGNTPITILASDSNGFALTANSLVDRAVPIFEINDRVKAYVEPWKNNGESDEEKIGGAVSSNFDPINISYSTSGYTDNGGGNYTYDTDILYTFQVSCEKGELIKIMMLTYNDDTVNNDYNCTTLNYFTWAIVDGSGEDFSIANALPSISQLDYITDALRTFNLFYNIDESNKTISFVKRAKYFKGSNPIDMPFSLHDRTFTQSKAPRTLYLGLNQIDNDGYNDQLDGLRKIEANPFADRDKVFQFASQFFGQAFPRLYTIESQPRDSLQFEIPTLSPNNSTDIFRNDVGELKPSTAPRLIFRGNGENVYTLLLPSIGIANILIDEFSVSQLPISRVDNFVSFNDGDTIFGNYWNDDFLYQATDVLTISTAMTSGQFNAIDLRRSIVLENNTYIIQEISGFNPLNPKFVTLKLLRL